ncbi:MAG: replication factor C large subunit [Methanomassiliicoccaceae archaeon]|nr:replication factor C large subunit [Methanomassiliicoccaceae archaeon]
MAEDWTEKYRPRRLSEVIGNPGAAKELREWAESWGKGVPKKRAVVLMGAPGVGKTSSAGALANEMGWDMIEMNASDQRTGGAIKDVALRGSGANSLGFDEEYRGSSGGQRKLIVLDEADNLFGNADRGALPVINELIKTTRQPVILIVNDFYALSKKSATVKSDTLQITFRKPVAKSIAGALRRIADAEGVAAGDDALLAIAENAGGDVRAAVRDLEALSHGRGSIDIGSVEGLQERFAKKEMYDVLERMFRGGDPFGALSALRDVDIEADTALLWVDENLPYEYKDPRDLVRGYDMLSRADVFLGRVRRRQHFRLRYHASVVMTAGVSVSRAHGGASGGRLRFPQYLSRMSRSKASRGLMSSVSLKIARFTHTSSARVEADVAGAVREIALNDAGFRAMLARDAGLEPEELGQLLNMKIDAKAVKDAYQAQPRPPKAAPAPQGEAGGAAKGPPPEREAVPPAPPAPAAEGKPQSKLLDF